MVGKRIPSPDELLLQLSEQLKASSYAPNIKKYQPHTKQAMFHQATAKKKLYLGGNRSGKTTAGVCEDIWRATCRHPYRQDLNEIGPNRGRVIAVDFTKGIDGIIMPQVKQWIYPSAIRGGAWETAYDKSTRTLFFDNGSFIEFMSYDQDIDKFAGTSRHWVHFDEEPPHTIFNENKARLIDTNGDFWMTMTPLLGMNWVYDELYEPNHGVENPDVYILEINMYENPYLKEEAIDEFRKGIDEEEVTARIGGAFVRKGGLIYKNFDPTVGGPHVLSSPIDPALVFDWLWICSLDHGLNNPTSVHWTAWDKNGFGIVFAEHYQNEWSIDMHAKRILEIEKRLGRAADLRVADPSITNRTAISMTSVQEEYQKYGLGFTLGNNDKQSGIIRVKRYLNKTKYVGRVADKLREQGIVPATDEFPRLRVTPDCEKFIWEAKRYRWKTYRDKKLQYENNPYDEPHDKDNHAMDDIRYMIMTRPDLRAENENLSEVLDEIMHGTESIGRPKQRDVADPFGRLETPGFNSDLNSLPNSAGQWEYDEHMGGVF